MPVDEGEEDRDEQKGKAMRTHRVLALAGLLVLGTALTAKERVVTGTTKIGKQVITTIETLKPPPTLGKEAFSKMVGPPVMAAFGPPPVQGKDQIGNAWAKGVCLEARDWYCGRCFT